MAGRTFLFCPHSLPGDYKRVYVCVRASYPLWGEERWGYKHISSGEMIRTPLLRKEAPKSTVAETIFECEKFWNIYHTMMHDSGSPFVFYMYLHTHTCRYIHRDRAVVDVFSLVNDGRKGSGMVPIFPFPRFSFSGSSLAFFLPQLHISCNVQTMNTRTSIVCLPVILWLCSARLHRRTVLQPWPDT